MMTTIEQMHHLFGAKVVQIKQDKNYDQFDHIFLEANGLHYIIWFDYSDIKHILSYEKSDNIPINLQSEYEYYVEDLEIKRILCHKNDEEGYVEIGVIPTDDLALINCQIETYIINTHEPEIKDEGF